MGNTITLEVCCGGVDDALEAFEAGADRIELNSALNCGGLTTTLGTLRQVLRSVHIPVICMLRPRAGGFCYTEREFEVMLEDAAELMKAGAAGVAFGFLTSDGCVDELRTRALVAALNGGQAVFHRAFDTLSQPREQAIDALVRAGVCRVLTSGRRADSLSGAYELKKCVDYAAGRVQILAGGGVRPENAKEIVGISGVTQLHFSCHSPEYDLSAAGNPELNFDCTAPAERHLISFVDKDRLVRVIDYMRTL